MIDDGANSGANSKIDKTKRPEVRPRAFIVINAVGEFWIQWCLSLKGYISYSNPIVKDYFPFIAFFQIPIQLPRRKHPRRVQAEHPFHRLDTGVGPPSV